jgi:hypothetical protein
MPILWLRFCCPSIRILQVFLFDSGLLYWGFRFYLTKFFKTDGDTIQLYFSKIELGITLPSKWVAWRIMKW